MTSLQQIVDTLIMVGNGVMVNKRFIIGVNAVWFYDYFLTLSDEIEWAWSGRNSLIFALFILNRYWPGLYLIWMTIALWDPGYTKAMCNHTSWLHVFYFTLATLFAQIAITLRVYAVTGNDKRVCFSLFLITFVEFAFGMYLSIRFALQPPLALPDIPFDEFNLCTFTRWRPGEIFNTVLSLVYDTLAFLIIVVSVKRKGLVNAVGVPNLFDTIFRDATMYFLAIFSSHALLILFEGFAPKPYQLIPANLNAVLLPIMATRLMLSLKRVASSPGSMWSFHNTVQPDTIRFAGHTMSGTEFSDDSYDLKNLPSKNKSSQTPAEP